ncbi:YdeI/OmpD-associated family protein [Abyssalbus ytuae]|uniref:YdeI/OmpD-associated family protein n=1 Tax=Abyssalbus ytuae TaxID=2926907 RepID=A0A9E7CYU2_9FLAO|nr:DUF1801 domain-containing protein [Abyssalbus ytuae]UOB16990.1 YdeI/OmpD-associated family protein [Abyssalbus ytuae]
MKKFTIVDDYIKAHGQWHNELTLLRNIFLQTEMEENIKWNSPVYSLNGKNIAGLAAFKNYVGIWFFQGVFLKDNKKVLVNAQENKTAALRQWRFQSVNDIDEKLVKSYLKEAIQNQKEGKELKPQKKKPLIIPTELQQAFKADKKLKTAFDAFTLSRQREFTDYITEAKRQATKISRLEKIKPMILTGTGLHDKYRNC